MSLQMALFCPFLWLSYFHCRYVPHLYPFLCWWTFRLLQSPGYGKECCSEHWGVRIFSNYGFSGYMPRNSGQSQIWDLILLQFSSIFRDTLVASVLNHSSYSYFYFKYMMCLFSNLIHTFVLFSSEMYALSHLLKVPSYFCVKLTVLPSVGFCLERPFEFSYQQSFLQHFLF